MSTCHACGRTDTPPVEPDRIVRRGDHYNLVSVMVVQTVERATGEVTGGRWEQAVKCNRCDVEVMSAEQFVNSRGEPLTSDKIDLAAFRRLDRTPHDCQGRPRARRGA